MELGESDVSIAETTDTVAESKSASDSEKATGYLSLGVVISECGPCRKRIAVTVPELDLAKVRTQLLKDYTTKASLPGFRVGHVPRAVVQSRFRVQLADELKQRVLVQSLEQLAKDHNIDPINEPDMDVESLEIPATGNFNYSFEVEVRPNVQIPKYADLLIKRPMRTVTDSDIQNYLNRLLIEYGEKTPTESPAREGDFVTFGIQFEYNGKPTGDIEQQRIRIQPVLKFSDAEISDFAGPMVGITAGESRVLDVLISRDAAYIPMRSEKVSATFTAIDIREFKPAEVDSEFLDRFGESSESEVRNSIREILERHVVYRQRQSCRRQLLEQITESATWELPDELVMKQVENAMHREIIEMQQAGYTPKEIQTRENDLRQRSLAVTRQAMKEHFVLDKIATDEKIEVTAQDIETEISLMAIQSGETPRRVRARLEKTRVIENLEAQIRERKAVDIALERATFEDVPLEEDFVEDPNVESIDNAICSVMFPRTGNAVASA